MDASSRACVLGFLATVPVWIASGVVWAQEDAELAEQCNRGKSTACDTLVANAANSASSLSIGGLKKAVSALSNADTLERIARRCRWLEVRRAALRNPAMGTRASELAPFLDPEVTRTVEDQEHLGKIARAPEIAPRAVRMTAVMAIKSRDELDSIVDSKDERIEDVRAIAARRRLLTDEQLERHTDAKNEQGLALLAKSENSWRGGNLKKANALFDEACSEGLVAACLNRTRLALSSDPLDHEPKLLPALRSTCDGGNSTACLRLGVALLKGPEEAPEKAVAPLEKACGQGSGEACQRLAELYRKGRVVARNGEKAQQLEAGYVSLEGDSWSMWVLEDGHLGGWADRVLLSAGKHRVLVHPSVGPGELLLGQSVKLWTVELSLGREYRIRRANLPGGQTSTYFVPVLVSRLPGEKWPKVGLEHVGSMSPANLDSCYETIVPPKGYGPPCPVGQRPILLGDFGSSVE
jgi:hypothetical protein